MKLSSSLALMSGPFALAACFSAPVERPITLVTQQTNVRVDQSVKNQVDMVFMVDDSLSMRPKQEELRARFPELIKVLDDFSKKGSPADYHIGVVTSDLGSGPTVVSSNCKPGGKGGRFQAIGAGAMAGCVGPTGKAYIEYNQLMKDGNGNPVSNLPGNKSVDDLAATFTCMSSVGDGGCGFEHQLEAVYRAVHDAPNLAENQGFFRPNALLVIVFVTDEDDCSADPNTTLFSQPDTSAMYGAQNSYRCTHFSVMRDDPAGGSTPVLMPYGDSGGAVMNPRSATVDVGQLLFPIDRYTNYFGKSSAVGGAKLNPQDVIMVGITAPSEPTSSVLAIKGSTNPLQPCSAQSATCLPTLQHSCSSPNNPLFYGDPAVRLNGVINSLAADHRQLTSICDTSYQSALQGLGQLIVSQIGPGCISSPFKDPNNPDCTVTDITPSATGGDTTKAIPPCKDSGGMIPAGGACWQLVKRNVDTMTAKACQPTCENVGDAAQQFGVEILRAKDPDSGTRAQVACATVAIPPRTGPDPLNPLGCGP